MPTLCPQHLRVSLKSADILVLDGQMSNATYLVGWRGIVMFNRLPLCHATYWRAPGTAGGMASTLWLIPQSQDDRYKYKYKYKRNAFEA